MDPKKFLRARILSEAKSQKFGGQEIRYLPSIAVKALTSWAAVKSVVYHDFEQPPCPHPEDHNSFVNMIFNQAKRMFLMCIYAKLDMEYLQELLQSNLTDANIKPSSRPYSEKWKTFLTAAWIFEPVKLETYTFGEVIPNLNPLPIVFDTSKQGAQIGSGSSATIFRAQFLEQYCDIPQLGKDRNNPTLTEFCTLKKYEKTTAAGDCAKREWAFAAWLASYPQLRDDPHITKTFLGFWYDENAYLVSELAAVSLQDLLDGVKTAGYDLIWLRKQIVGLTRALSIIHGPSQGRTASHNDIQPANILVFANEGNNLKFTDWGQTKLTETAGNPKIVPSDDLKYLGSVFVNILMWMYGDRDSLEYSNAWKWFTADPCNPVTGFLESEADDVFTDLKKRLPNMLDVIDVIYEMVCSPSTNGMRASNALVRFKNIPGPW